MDFMYEQAELVQSAFSSIGFLPINIDPNMYTQIITFNGYAVDWPTVQEGEIPPKYSINIIKDQEGEELSIEVVSCD